MASSDFGVLNLLPRLNAAQTIQEKLEATAPGSSESKFLNMLGTHLYASNLASTEGMIMRWSELEPHFDGDGKMTYGRTEVLSYLLRSSRNRAIANLSICHKRGIPCPAAIACFQSAEMLRDASDEDRVNVLVSYWEASLQALRMVFSPQK